MHNHNNSDSSFSWMMGLMMICCVVPFVLVFFGGQAFLSGGFRWWLGGLMLAFIAWHFWSMRKGQCHSPSGQPVSGEEQEQINKEADKTPKH